MEDVRDPAPAERLAATRLTLRLLGALAIGSVLGLVVNRLVETEVPIVAGIGLGLATTAVVTTLLVRRAVSPVLRTQADLEIRYETAKADALVDPLTALGNHRAFHEELDRQVEASRRYGVPFSLMLIDLDEFKMINDGKGHAVGDRVLRHFGQLLNGTLRRADRAFRVGGDEFAVLLPHTDAQSARHVARRVLALALQPPLRDEGAEPVSFSAGISAMPELADERARLYAQADTALYAAKRGGRTDIAVFDPTSEATASDDGASAAIAEVIARGQLRPVYQPIVDLTTGAVLGVEGLIRPVQPAPYTDPAGLFAAAEASGRLIALDMACVETIVAGAISLPPDQFLSVNLSPQTVEAPEFSTNALLTILSRHRFPPSRLVIELTEHHPIADVERARMKLDACRDAGIRLAADDIGAGNAGLRLLAEIVFDVLKVDLSLVRRSAPGTASSAVVGSVVELASRTGAMVIAEGVEHQSQVAQLTSLGVRAAQGFYLGKPGPLVAVEPVDSVLGDLANWRQAMGLASVAGT